MKKFLLAAACATGLSGCANTPANTPRTVTITNNTAASVSGVVGGNNPYAYADPDGAVSHSGCMTAIVTPQGPMIINDCG